MSTIKSNRLREGSEDERAGMVLDSEADYSLTTCDTSSAAGGGTRVPPC